LPASECFLVEFLSTGGAPSLPFALERGCALRACVLTAVFRLGTADRPDEPLSAATSCAVCSTSAPAAGASASGELAGSVAGAVASGADVSGAAASASGAAAESTAAGSVAASGVASSVQDCETSSASQSLRFVDSQVDSSEAAASCDWSATAVAASPSTSWTIMSPAPAENEAPAKNRVANERLIAIRRTPERRRRVSCARAFACFAGRSTARATAANESRTKRTTSPERRYVRGGIAFAPISR
jgi:hypothetical protein